MKDRNIFFIKAVFSVQDREGKGIMCMESLYDIMQLNLGIHCRYESFQPQNTLFFEAVNEIPV